MSIPHGRTVNNITGVQEGELSRLFTEDKASKIAKETQNTEKCQTFSKAMFR